MQTASEEELADDLSAMAQNSLRARVRGNRLVVRSYDQSASLAGFKRRREDLHAVQLQQKPGEDSFYVGQVAEHVHGRSIRVVWHISDGCPDQFAFFTAGARLRPLPPRLPVVHVYSPSAHTPPGR